MLAEEERRMNIKNLDLGIGSSTREMREEREGAAFIQVQTRKDAARAVFLALEVLQNIYHL